MTALATAPEELEELDLEEAAILERLSGGQPLTDYIIAIAPHQPPPRHLERLIEVLERARFQRVKVLLAMPPGHAKTITLLRAIAWWLRATPADTCAYLSYSDTQAWSKSKIARNIAEESGVELDPEFASAAEWRTLQGGGMLASGVGGRLTGNRVTGLAVVDDPFKSYRDAASAAVREDVWNWYSAVVQTRLQDCSIVVVHTRWHPDDLIGRLEKEGDWEVINLQALCERGSDNADPLGRLPGEALWPEMYPVDELERLRRSLGEFLFAALYQGRPRIAGHHVFSPNPARFDLKAFDPAGCVFVIGVDVAGTKKTSADYSVAVLMAMRKRPGQLPLFYVLAVLREQVTVPTFSKKLRAFQIRHGHPHAYVEAVGVGKALPDVLKEIDGALLVSEAPMMGDKFLRAQPFAAAWNDGRALVPLEADWDVEVFIHELQEFTGVNDPVDDQVDGSAHAFNGLAALPEPLQHRRRPEGARQMRR